MKIDKALQQEHRNQIHHWNYRDNKAIVLLWTWHKTCVPWYININQNHNNQDYANFHLIKALYELRSLTTIRTYATIKSYKLVYHRDLLFTQYNLTLLLLFTQCDPNKISARGPFTKIPCMTRASSNSWEFKTTKIAKYSKIFDRHPGLVLKFKL